MGNLNRKACLYLLLLVCTTTALFGLGLNNHGLWTPDEPRVAEIGREMAFNGNWAVPMLNQRPFLEQPPLYYATLAIFFKVFGVSDGVARLPSAAFAFGGVIVLFFLTHMLLGPRPAFIAGFVMATCAEYFRVAHWVIVDGALTFFVLLSLTFFMMAYRTGDKGRRLLLYVFCYVSCALAFLTKGFIGVIIPGLAVLLFLILRKDVREIVRMQLWLGVAIFFVIVVPWFVELWRQGGREYLEVFLLHNHLGRFAGGVSGHDQPFYYYLVQFPLGFLPWSLLIPPVFYRAFRKADNPADSERIGLLFAKCWFVAGLVFLSVASTKRLLYLMPIFAPISVMTAWFIESTLKGIAKKNFEKLFSNIFALVPLLAGAVTIPIYLFFCRRYSIPPSWSTMALIIAFSLVSVILSFEALWRYRSDLGHFWFLCGGSVFSLLLLLSVAVIPILDGFKSFVPFCRELSAMTPPSAPLYAYRPDETLRGAVPFYTGRHLLELETVESLVKAAEQEGPVFVTARDRRGQLKAEVLGTGRFSVLMSRGTDAGRSLLLFREESDTGTNRQ